MSAPAVLESEKASSFDAHVARLVATAPPLPPETRDRIAAILGGAS